MITLNDNRYRLNFAHLDVSDTHWSYSPTVDNPLVEQAELRILMRLAVPDTFRQITILEIGTHRGSTTGELAKIVRPFGGKVVTVDVSSVPDTLPPGQRNEVLDPGEVGCLIPSDLFRYVDICMIHSGGLGDLLAARKEWYDLIFIDGDHSYEGVSSDFEDVVPHRVDAHAPVCLHDVWWDVIPPPVDGPLRLACEHEMTVLNLTHMAIWR